VLHPQNTKIVYCKDANRQDVFPNIHFDFLDLQFRARKSSLHACGLIHVNA
jgi:RNA-directed DNA polymerase